MYIIYPKLISEAQQFSALRTPAAAFLQAHQSNEQDVQDMEDQIRRFLRDNEQPVSKIFITWLFAMVFAISISVLATVMRILEIRGIIAQPGQQKWISLALTYSKIAVITFAIVLLFLDVFFNNLANFYQIMFMLSPLIFTIIWMVFSRWSVIQNNPWYRSLSELLYCLIGFLQFLAFVYILVHAITWMSLMAKIGQVPVEEEVDFDEDIESSDGNGSESSHHTGADENFQHSPHPSDNDENVLNDPNLDA